MVVGGCLCAATGAFFCEAGAVSYFFEKGDTKPLVQSTPANRVIPVLGDR